MKKLSAHRLIILATVVCWLPTTGLAKPPYNLDFLQPVSVEDAYPVEEGKMQLQLLNRFETPADNWLVLPEYQWGLAKDWQLEFSVPLWLGGGDHDGTGDVQAGALWHFAKEQDAWADFALAGKVVIPTGEDSAGLDTTLQLIGTKSLTQDQSADKLHLNLNWTHDAGAGDEVDENRFAVIFGYSRALSENTTFVADLLYSEQEQEEAEWVVLEVGLNHKIDQHWSFSGGLGTALNDEGPDLLLMSGIQYEF